MLPPAAYHVLQLLPLVRTINIYKKNMEGGETYIYTYSFTQAKVSMLQCRNTLLVTSQLLLLSTFYHQLGNSALHLKKNNIARLRVACTENSRSTNSQGVAGEMRCELVCLLSQRATGREI